MKARNLIAAAVLMGIFTLPAHALEYSIEATDQGLFGRPTSDETVYVGTGESNNVDRGKNSALVPPGFGTPTSYLPNSGEPLTSNLAVNSNNSITYPTVTTPSITYPTVTTPSVTYPTTAYTAVTSDLYYLAGHLGTLKIPTIGLTVKVYEGTGDTPLSKGAGHFTNTSIWNGNVSVAAHNRGTNNHFGQIHTLSIGARMTLTTQLGTRTYSVTSVYKVSETDNAMLEATSENCITLFTCVRNQPAYRWCVRAVEI